VERSRAARWEIEKRAREEYVRMPDPPSTLGEGERNRGLFAYAAALRNAGLGEQEIFEHVRSVNDGVCCPPLSEMSVRTIARSVMRYAPSARVSPAPGILSRFRGIISRKGPYDPFA
jgi:putative DNA primase/helicase